MSSSTGGVLQLYWEAMSGARLHFNGVLQSPSFVQMVCSPPFRHQQSLTKVAAISTMTTIMP